MKAKCWTVVKKFEGLPKESDMAIVEHDLALIKDGEFLAEATILSIDPYLRLIGNVEGNTMVGDQIAKVIESKHAGFPVGTMVTLSSGMRSHTVSDGSNARLLPKLDGQAQSLALGVMGMAGATAFVGVNDILEAKEGQVLFVNAAAGAVGSIVGQLAKQKGCTVIGCASSQAKLDYLMELGFDRVFNYKEKDTLEALKELAPKGIDLFFDNVGGATSSGVISQMNSFGRVAVCGAVSGYNDPDKVGSKQTGPLPYTDCLMKQIRIQGYLYWSNLHRLEAAESYILKLIKEGKLKFREFNIKGFDKMPAALIQLFEAKHVGKMLLHV